MCKVEWCSNTPNRSGKGHCRTHYDQMRKYGKILDKRSRYNPNDIIIHEEYAEVILRNSKQIEVARSIIDIEDIEKINKYKWSLHDKGYVRAEINRKAIYMHRVLTGVSEGKEVDHINLNKLDNRKNNLRLCTHAQNCMNRKNKYNGITIRNDINKKFHAGIRANKKQISLGYFYTKEEALRARKEAERKYFGEFQCKS